MPTGPNGEKRPADPVANAVHVMKIATGQIEETYAEPRPAERNGANPLPVSDWRAAVTAVLLAAGCADAPATAPAPVASSAPAPPSAPVVPAPPPSPLLQAEVSVYSIPSPYSGDYTEGMWMRLTAEFDEFVRVTDNPRIAIQIGDNTRYADATPDVGRRYSGPDHRAQQDTLLRFDYLIQADDRAPDGIVIEPDAFDFTEGVIENRQGIEVNVEITSIIPAEFFDTGGFSPARRWAESREPGTHISECPVAGRPSPRVCTDELERARGRHRILPREWDGTPFTFYFSTNGMPSDMYAEAERALLVHELLAERIEEQNGYPLFEVGGFLDNSRAEYDRSCSWREPGQIVAFYGDSPQVNHGCAMWQKRIYPGLDNGSISLQTFHLLGFDYSPNDWRKTYDYWTGYWRSLRLTGVFEDFDDIGVTFEDVDALRCIFPEHP